MFLPFVIYHNELLKQMQHDETREKPHLIFC